VALVIVLGRAGHGWETGLIGQANAHAPATFVTECRTVVDLLVRTETESPALVVVAEDFPRLTEAVSRLRALSQVVIVGDGPSADCPPERAHLDVLLQITAQRSDALGTITTVWGPPGSWGTTSVAVGLARSISRKQQTLLVDANVHAPSVGELLNVPLGGLLQACLAADRGAPEVPARALSNRLHVLSGVDPAVYPAVHPGAMQQVLDAARSGFQHVVLDVDSAIDPAGEIGLVPDWTTATAVGLRAADHVVIVVGDSEPAQARLWRSLPAVAEVTRGRTTVVVNRCADPRRTTAHLAGRLGDYLPDAAVGWIGGQITEKALRPIVEEVVDGLPTRAG